MILILVAFIAVIAFIATFLFDAITLTSGAAKVLFLLSLILSAVFALKAKIGFKVILEKGKSVLVTPIRTILVWAMAFETFLLIFSIEGLAISPFTIVFYGFCISGFFIFWYVDLAKSFLTYENYDETSKFTATFSRRNWKFLILSGIAAAASIMFYDKAFQIVNNIAISQLVIYGLLILIPFEPPLSIVTIWIFYFIITGIFVKVI